MERTHRFCRFFRPPLHLCCCVAVVQSLSPVGVPLVVFRVLFKGFFAEEFFERAFPAAASSSGYEMLHKA